MALSEKERTRVYITEFGIRDKESLKKIKLELNDDQGLYDDVTITYPASTGTLATTADVSAATEFADNVFRVQDNTDPTKELALECSGITTATTRTLTVPDVSSTILFGTYETSTNAPTTHPWASANVGTYHVQRVSNMVIFILKRNVNTATSATTLVYTGIIPAGFRPDVNFIQEILVSDNGVVVEGEASVGTTGNIIISPGLSGANFTGANGAGNEYVHLVFYSTP